MAFTPTSHFKSVQFPKQGGGNGNMLIELSQRYEQLYQSERHYDCVFHVGGTLIKCHKLILSAASPVFDAMFYGPMCEQNSDIDILDMSAENFNLLVSYIYSGVLSFDHLTLEESIELYYGAEKYLLSDLNRECLQAIKRKLRFFNILPALELSVCMELNGLLEVCMSFFMRCCLSDTQFMAYHKSNYEHISKECVKAIIAAYKVRDKHLLWFVHEWCQQECRDLGLQQANCSLIINDLQLSSNDVDFLASKPPLQHCSVIERSYYKACRPFTVDDDTLDWKFYLRCDRFISLVGLIMHSRLAPNMMTLAAQVSHTSQTRNFPMEYQENLRIEISVEGANITSPPIGYSDGEESDQEIDMDAEDMSPQRQTQVIWHYNVKQQPTKYNCDLNINWSESVTLSPDVEYQIRLIWQADAYGAEYPCSLQSDEVDGIQFRDSYAHNGSLLKGLRFINLV